MKVRYTVLDGDIVSENRGGIQRDYVADPLGSTVALLDSGQNQTDKFTYWPYGSPMSRMGSTDTPFRYVGAFGYYQDSPGRIYVRARHLHPQSGRWLTQDPIRHIGIHANRYMPLGNVPLAFGEGQTSYCYGGNNPLTTTDSSGLRPIKPGDPRWPRLKPTLPPLIDPRSLFCVQGLIHNAYAIAGKYNLKGEYGGPQDAFRHCVWACLARRKCGRGAFLHGVIDHEREGATWAKGSWDPTYSPQDVANDWRGAYCSVRGESCEQECMKDLKAARLYILPGKYWSK